MIIPPTLPALNAAIIRRAQSDLPIVESPLGSNRSPEIDALCAQFGVPLASYWCALWAAAVWQDAGAEIPPTKGDSHPARAESWHQWAKKTGRFSTTPSLGAAVLYGTSQHAEHIGVCVVALEPILLDFEGNTSFDGLYNRNGIISTLKLVDPKRVIGYVSPEAAVHNG